jgi:heterodisulfide reductase subunit A-like polyferredoxin
MSDNNNSVLVVGGGIAGIQASIDLANMGFQVYLVEQSPSIGGRMAQLDKTFPTNDCAMCILAPKMIECYRHENVKVLSYSEVAAVEGELGSFQARILMKPRYIDETKCTGCGECAEQCPVEVISEFNQGMGKRKAIYKPFAQAIPNLYVIDRKGISPCRDGCPAGTRVQGYVALTSKGKFQEALDVVRETLPFPAICGRACHHPCEDQCNRRDVDEPVSIRALKRFISDWARENGEAPPQALKPTREEKVAVVGAGPSGLTCALRLLEMGYPVTVFEASGKAGGMVTGCIPDYRIPTEIASYDIDRVLASGVEVKTNTRVGKDITFEQLKNDYKAIFVAVGCQDAARLPVEGAEAQGVLYGLPFLQEAKASGKVEGFGQKAIVIGGGNVGIDCARTALRLGAKEVHLVCLETRDLTSRDRMPAHSWEIEEAEEEGVIIHGSLGPKNVLSENGRVAGLETAVCTSVYDEGGRFAPKFSEGSGPSIAADTLIIAIGQRSDLTGFEGLEKTARGTIGADEVTLETNLPGVFAGGDIVRGPASIIEAVAQGNEAAISIERFINGLDLREGRAKEAEAPVPLPEREIEQRKRIELRTRAPEERVRDFLEIELALSAEAAIEEASRCLNCAVCSDCRLCEKTCQASAIRYDQEARYMDVNVGAVILATGLDLYDVSKLGEYGYGRIENVITAMEYERLTSASGPTAGELMRPSDGKLAKNIAFIQCVGSRDFRHKAYCSSVCCMHATKEAILAYEHHPGTKSTIFYMDLRAVGKRFQEYIARARDEYNVTYVRGRPARIDVAENGNPIIWYEDTTTRETKTFETELVILSQALVPSVGVRELAARLGITLDEYGFVGIPDRLSHPLDTSRAGFFACGYAHSPRDIPDSVIQASGSAARAAEVLAGGAEHA